MAVVLQHHRQQVQSLRRELEGRRGVPHPPGQQVVHPRLALHRARRQARKHGLAREHDEEHDAAAPDVRLGPIGASPQLRRHVCGGALDLVAPPMQVEAAAHAEVNHLQVAERPALIHEVLGLDVKVAAVLRMAALDRLQHMPQSDRGVDLGHPPLRFAGDSVEEVWPVAELEDQVQVALLVEVLDQLHDVRMVQRQQRLQLVLMGLSSAMRLAQPLDRT
mmetsp:Transcript_102465/g.287192  ORF Transcript_102465/g.287192 Transcript_102465/m.287192 type:complete len:220 (+) Transcript_102465:233-892(+)